MNDQLASRVYEGWVRHRRYLPRQHVFKYKVFMMYLDLSEIDAVVNLSRFWTRNKLGLARFSRKDFMGDPATPLDNCVRDLVEAKLGFRPSGPIRVLANLRYFGYCTNPLTTYYCFDLTGERLEAIVAEVTNTPWNERHAYVLHVDSSDKFRCSFKKQFHVSPFNPIAMEYRWFSNVPAEHLSIHLENWQSASPALSGGQEQVLAIGKEKVMDATIQLTASEISGKKLNRLLIAYPLMTVKVISAIYWQALKLALKRVPFYSHPNVKACD